MRFWLINETGQLQFDGIKNWDQRHYVTNAFVFVFMVWTNEKCFWFIYVTNYDFIERNGVAQLFIYISDEKLCFISYFSEMFMVKNIIWWFCIESWTGMESSGGFAIFWQEKHEYKSWNNWTFAKNIFILWFLFNFQEKNVRNVSASM